MIYTDQYGVKALKGELYKKVVGNKTFKELEQQAIKLGVNPITVALATDEQLAYYIYTKVS
jgi:hypothetical protein